MSEIQAVIDEVADKQLVVMDGAKPVAIPLTVRQLIEYIHETGACVSRPTFPERDETG